MTSTAFTVLVYFNGSIYVEDNYSDKFISSNTAWVTITNTMTLSQLKQAILKEFNCATLDDYEVDLRYKLPIFISGDITHYWSCTMCGDDDVESIFYMGMNKSMSSSSWDNGIYYSKAKKMQSLTKFILIFLITSTCPST